MVDTVNVPATGNPPAPEGHDAKMEAMGAHAVDGGMPNAPATGDTPPANIPAEPPATTPAEPKGDTPPDAAAEALKGTGLELASFQEEFAAKGELSADSYEKLAKAGLPKEVVDQYIEGQKALAQAIQAEAFALVGGQPQYTAMIEWAANTLSEADKAAFNQAVDQGGAAAKLAIAGLNSQFRTAQGSNPQLLQGFAPSGVDAVTGFRSTQELVSAMADPRYHRDPAYRKDVEARVAASKLF